MRTVLLISALFLLPCGATAAGAGYLYNAKFVQAAPGKLLALIDHYKSRMSGYSTAGDEPPMWIRHSQGDKWDLMLLSTKNERWRTLIRRRWAGLRTTSSSEARKRPGAWLSPRRF